MLLLALPVVAAAIAIALTAASAFVGTVLSVLLLLPKRLLPLILMLLLSLYTNVSTITAVTSIAVGSCSS